MTSFATDQRRVFATALSALVVIAALATDGSALSKQHLRRSSAMEAPCRQMGARACLVAALEAMGGQSRLENIKSAGIETIGHTFLTEQSYRQDPFITSYERAKIKIDFIGSRVVRELHTSWPESDPGQSESDTTLVAGLGGGVYRSKADNPCSPADLDWTHAELFLGPLRLLLTALQARDLHFAGSELIRSTPHAVLGFTWEGKPVRIMINPFNHLPDAVETLEQFQDHWYQWGDVRRRIYFDNFQVFHGVIYPTNAVEERNGTFWQSTQVLNLDFNIAVSDVDFRMDPAVAERSRQGKGWDTPFRINQAADLAPGVTLFQNSWNSTLVEQEDGLVIIETPRSSTYTMGLLDEARRRYPNVSVKAVLSTSDSWPHIGGVRQLVALGLPVYILDLNRPLLDRLVHSSHSLHPDALERSPRSPKWRLVSTKVVVGQGSNRIELYPLRGASTERQYMIYFPARHLLYASDTLVLNDDGSLYDPELMREVIQAVKREGLEVETVYGMHQGPTSWTQVVALVDKALA
jgi:hypothetical protein